mmetsp:Transcript_18260/g.54117  ORF Transcript_18260/g.54117 Transcript_18260/m.54117 type:complete len:240 (+) Transcript_18260:58-777(+)
MIPETLDEPAQVSGGTGRGEGGFDLARLLTALNPLVFTKLFTRTVALRTLVTTAALQCMCEGKAISDLKTYYFMNDVPAFTMATRGLYQTAWGLVMALSGLCGKELIRRLGMHGHTTVQNGMTALAFAMTARAPNVGAVFSVLPLYLFAMERRAAVSSWAVKEAVATGMGRGEYAAAFFNLRALATGLAPLLYVTTYSRGAGGVPRQPWWPWILAISFAGTAEVLHQSLRWQGIHLPDS